MKEFFAENWKFIVYLIFAIIGIVITILKKSKLVNETIDTPFERVLGILPRLINEAEAGGKSGKQKKDYVVYAALSILQKIREKELTIEEIDDYSERIGDAVEQILGTPTKKGTIYGNEKKKD